MAIYSNMVNYASYSESKCIRNANKVVGLRHVTSTVETAARFRV